MTQKTENLRVLQLRPLISPGLLQEEIPTTSAIDHLILSTRQIIANTLSGLDDRLAVIVGPCSIHDPAAALEYARKLQPLVKLYENELCIIMRVYFEKPRTTVGWKGLINDPHLDNTFKINQGLRVARQLLFDINALGVPTGSEFLDTIIPQYLSDLTSWSAIGARTSESQVHRELASGLSMPLGFKNSTTGHIEAAVDGVYAAAHPHHFLGLTKQGICAIVTTAGNPDCHVILRGSNTQPNYDEQTIARTVQLLSEKKLHPKVMIDCSHGNSRKNHLNQIIVAQELCQQIAKAQSPIFGLMLESNLIAGKQSLEDEQPLTYGQSITDACIGWEDTEKLLAELSKAQLSKRSCKI
jgi:3-deoxy-7-phosphoheptulonate synthase